MCIMELVDYNEAMLGGEAAKTKTTRRRRTTRKKEEAAAETKTPKTTKPKAAKSEKPVEKVDEAAGDSVPEGE
jgi:sRNA-binding protein